MEAERFDRLVRSLSATPVRRRGVLGLLSSLLLSTTSGNAADAKRRRDRGDKKRHPPRDVQADKKNGGNGGGSKGNGGNGRGKGDGGKKGGGKKGGKKSRKKRGNVIIAPAGEAPKYAAGTYPVCFCDVLGNRDQSGQCIPADARDMLSVPLANLSLNAVIGSCEELRNHVESIGLIIPDHEGNLTNWGFVLGAVTGGVVRPELANWDSYEADSAGEVCVMLKRPATFTEFRPDIWGDVMQWFIRQRCTITEGCRATNAEFFDKVLRKESEHVRDLRHLAEKANAWLDTFLNYTEGQARQVEFGGDPIAAVDSPLKACAPTKGEAVALAFSKWQRVLQETLDEVNEDDAHCTFLLDSGPHSVPFEDYVDCSACSCAGGEGSRLRSEGTRCICCPDEKFACDTDGDCDACQACADGCCELDCGPCKDCVDERCVAVRDGEADPGCPDACHLCAEGECFDPCDDDQPCCGDQCCGGCLTCRNDQCVPVECEDCSACSPDTGTCEPDPTCCPNGAICHDYTFEFHGQEFIQARPGDRVRFTMTVPANSDALPRDFDWYYADDYELRTCKDLDSRPRLTQCENDLPAHMQIGDIIPGASWREVTRGKRISRIPAVWAFDWHVPNDDTPRSYEISVLAAFPSTYTEDGGARSCCHKVRIRTTQELHAETTGWGAVTSDPAGISCSLVDRRSDCYEEPLIGSTVALTATPEPGATFLGWGAHCNGQEGSTCTLAMDESRRARADFSGTAFVFRMHGQETIEARPGDHVSFTMTVTAGSEALPVGFDWYYGSDFEIKPCRDTDPREGLVQCENDNTATMDIGDVLPGATWREVIRGDRLQGVQGVWKFEWDVPQGHPPGTQEISFLVTFPTTYGDGGGARSCCHKVRFITNA